MEQTYPRFETVPYRPEGGFSSTGYALLLVGSLVGGLLLGVIAGFLARWFYLVLIFPLFIGMGVGGIGYWAIRQGRVRNAVLGGISGLLGGFFAMLSMHYMHYLEFESNAEATIPAEVREKGRAFARMSPEEIQQLPVPPEDQQAILQVFGDPVQRAMFLVEDFPSYMHYRATVGVTFNSVRGGNKNGGTNLGYIGSWIYWTIEVLIVAGIALVVQSQAAKEPFCSLCQCWKETRDLGPVPDTDAPALQEGDLTHFNSPPSQQAGGVVMVSVSTCPSCGEECPVDVKLSNLTQTNEGVTRTEIAHVTYPGDALPYLEKIFQPPADQPEEGTADNAEGRPAPEEPLASP